MIGGMVVQILIQAAILRALLLLIAKHEADTSFAKAAMVAAGISLGTFLVAAFTQHMGLLVTIPAQIALMTAVLMTFCWISVKKSILVVIIYSSVHFLLKFLIMLILGAVFKSVMPSNPMPMPVPAHGGSSVSQQGYQIPTPEQAMAESVRLREKADAKRRELEARVKEMEEGGARPVQGSKTDAAVPAPLYVIEAEPFQAPMPEPARKPLPAPVTAPRQAKVSAPVSKHVTKSKPVPVAPKPPPVSREISEEKVQLDASTSDWAAARKDLRVGGRMSVSSGYVAIINGKMVQEGDKVTVVRDGISYKWKVEAISKNRLDLQPVSASPVP